MLSNELRRHLYHRLIPFWIKLRDLKHGGYYGWVDSGLQVDETAVKGCILNSRILWFFSNAGMCLDMREGGDVGDAESAVPRQGTAAAGSAVPEQKIAAEGSAPSEQEIAAEGSAVPRQGTAAGNVMPEQEVAVEGSAVPRQGTAAMESAAAKAGERVADSIKESAAWAYRFLKEKCLDREKGGVYWSVDYTGKPEDTTKHTYNQAFAVYALSSYFRAYRDREALRLAEELIRVIEEKCFDEYGYKEALDRDFQPVPNDKLSENGVMADRTMNTLLHVMEAYTEYLLACREAEGITGASSAPNETGNAMACDAAESGQAVEDGAENGKDHAVVFRETGKGIEEGTEDETSVPGETVKGMGEDTEDETTVSGEAAEGDAETAGTGQAPLVREKLRWILNLIETRVYNPALHRQEVFFNRDMESLIDLHSYGHDIEAAWLMDRCLAVLGDEELSRRISPILRSLEKEVYEKAYTNHSLANECERGVVDTKRVWWVQAEGVVGFYNAWQKTGESRYREASEDIWQFIRGHLVDKREDGEWFWYTDAAGNPALEKPIVEPWKCPYHNGRMCMEIMRRSGKQAFSAE